MVTTKELEAVGVMDWKTAKVESSWSGEIREEKHLNYSIAKGMALAGLCNPRAIQLI